jgi:hypothetical protein
VHVNKAAGTTLKRAIEAQVRLERSSVARTCLTKDMDQWRTAKREQHVFAMGDYCMGADALLAGSSVYLSMLREPRSRTASSYLHCQLEPADQLCGTDVLDARNASFDAWVAHQGNYMVELLAFNLSDALDTGLEPLRAAASGVWRLRPQYTPNRLMLSRALRGASAAGAQLQQVLRLLEAPHVAIGVMEEFGLSMERLAEHARLAWLPRVAATQERIVHRGATGRSGLGGGAAAAEAHATHLAALVAEFDARPELRAAIAEDAQLYDAVTAKLRAWAAARQACHAMLCCAVLCCAVQCCAVLCCAVLCCCCAAVLLCCNVMCCTVL